MLNQAVFPLSDDRTYRFSFWLKSLILLVFAMQAAFCWMARERSLRGNVDLRAFYTAGVAVRRGNAADLYDTSKVTELQQDLFSSGRTLPFLYPPFAALPFAPLSYLPYVTVFKLVAIANLSMLLAAIWLLNRSLFAKKFSTVWLFGLSLCFFPASIALMQGQVSFALLLLFTLSFILCEEGRPVLSGICLSLALVKFQFVLPVMLLLLLGRRWRVVTGFVIGGTGVLAVSLLMTGLQGARSYLSCVTGLSTVMLHDPALAQTRFGMRTATEPNLHGLISALAGHGTGATLLLAAGSILAMAWAARRSNTVAMALPVAMLVSYHMQPYDLLLLLLPVFVLLEKALESRRTPLMGVKLLAGASLLLLTIPVAPYLLVHTQTVWLVVAVGCLMFLFDTGANIRLLHASSTDARSHLAHLPALGQGAGLGCHRASASITASLVAP